jgi:hypothetical protein
MNAVARITDREVSDVVSQTLRRAFNDNLKLVAIAGDVGPDTAKNWLEARNPPKLATFINMCRQCPELRAEAFRLMDPEAEFDPDFMRDFMRLAQTYSRLQASKAEG